LDPKGYPTNGGPVSNLIACLFCVRSTVEGIIHGYKMHNMNAFFQDDWKVNSHLTLNYGVRWEYNGTLADNYGNLTNIWPSDLRTVPIPPSAAGTSANAFVGYVVPNNYDAAAHGPLPAGIRQFGGQFASINSIPLSNFAPRIGFAWTPTNSTRFVVRGGFGFFYDRIGINQIVHAVQEGKPYADTLANVQFSTSLQDPFQNRPLAFIPRWFDLDPASPTYLQGSNFDSPFYDRIQTPLVRQYNLGMQYEFVRNYVLDIAFVGSSGINTANYSHVINMANLVCTALVTTNCTTGSINGITTNTASNAYGRVPFLGFSPIGLQQMGFDTVSNYNSMQATVRKTFSSGLAFQGAYTWSKNLSNIGYGSANLNLPNDMGQQYGQAPFSRPHVFVLNYQYQLPIKPTNKMLNTAIGGWTVSGVTTWQSGTPVTIMDSTAGSVYGATNSSIDKGLARAQMAVGATYDSIFQPGGFHDIVQCGAVKTEKMNCMFNPAAFGPALAVGNDGSTTFGNSGVGIIRGPHQLNFDFSVNKVFKITERQSLQFRTDFFNIFNHAQFFLNSYPGGNGAQLNVSGGGNLGAITSTSVAPRLIQFALRYAF